MAASPRLNLPPVGATGNRLDQYLRDVHYAITQLQDAASASAPQQTPVAITADQLRSIRDALSAGGAEPLNLTGLVGQSAQPQLAAPVVASTLAGLPPASAYLKGVLAVTTTAPYTVYFVDVDANGTHVWTSLVGVPSNMMTTDTGQAVSGTKTFSVDEIFSSTITKSGPNASKYVLGHTTELLTLSTVGATTDTSGTLIPGSSLVLAVSCFITTTISGGGVTTMKIGDAGQADRFFTSASLSAGNGFTGMDNWKGSVATDAKGPLQYGAEKIRVTMDGTPTQGAVRLVVFYLSMTAPSS